MIRSCRARSLRPRSAGSPHNPAGETHGIAARFKLEGLEPVIAEPESELDHLRKRGATWKSDRGDAVRDGLSCFTIGHPPDYGARRQRLNSVEAKIARAKEHFAQVQQEIDAWLEEGSFTVVYEQNEAGDEHYLKTRLAGAPPTVERWALILGDGMTNLRDSLDHLIYQISNPNPGKPLFRSAAFVIVRERDKFKGEANNKLAGLTRRTRAVVEAFQPFNRPHHIVAPSLLGALGTFANTNKHRLILPVFTVPQNLRFTLSTKTPSKGRVATMIGNIEDGSRFFVYKTDVPEPGTTINFAELKTEIALTHESLPDVPPLHAGRSPTRHLVLAISQEVEAAIRAVAASL
jgi:hypothetical protein